MRLHLAHAERKQTARVIHSVLGIRSGAQGNRFTKSGFDFTCDVSLHYLRRFRVIAVAVVTVVSTAAKLT